MQGGSNGSGAEQVQTFEEPLHTVTDTTAEEKTEKKGELQPEQDHQRDDAVGEEGVVDLAALVEIEFGNTPQQATLPVVRVGLEPIDIRLFTHDARETAVHWYKANQRWLLLRCNGENCVLCLASVRVQLQLLVPVVDAVQREIALLPIPKANWPGSLLQAISPYLNKKAGSMLLEISREANNRHQVSPLAGQDGLDMADDTIRSFMGRISKMTRTEVTEYFRSSYQQIDNQTLLCDFPELAIRIRNRHPDKDLEQL